MDDKMKSKLFVACLQLEIIDECVSYIEKLQSQLLVTRQYDGQSDAEDEEQQQQQQQQQQQHGQQQQQLRRLSSYELEDCNGNVEKWSEAADGAGGNVVYNFTISIICDKFSVFHLRLTINPNLDRNVSSSLSSDDRWDCEFKNAIIVIIFCCWFFCHKLFIF